MGLRASVGKQLEVAVSSRCLFFASCTVVVNVFFPVPYVAADLY